ncbi:DsbA family oxidoreductase [Burkholderia guangdongensis]|uniref:DsbA family oxidoreductase n=1 Tax=Burkholderia guangdongensis TaxID=1792500 RepID=UPI0015CC145C|nr:DsbA family oxidoreductase [Burkholderia guangdongensis]
MPIALSHARRPKLSVEIWSDLICPWCWIGKRRFDAALAAFPHADHVDVVLRAYRLMPGHAPEPVETMLAAKYGLAPAQVDRMLAQVTDAAASVGLRYDLPGTFAGDTLDAHRLVKLAETTGRAHALTERLYRAYFCEHGSLFDHAALLDYAVEVGLERAAAESLLGSDAFRDEVDADGERAARLGGRGVPLFVFGGRYAVSGAQPADAFAQALDHAWRDRAHAPSPGGAEAGACGPDGCALPPHA